MEANLKMYKRKHLDKLFKSNYYCKEYDGRRANEMFDNDEIYSWSNGEYYCIIEQLVAEWLIE